MKLKGILFDFDGTLADTLPICFYAFRQVFREFDNRELTEKEIASMFGPSETGIIEDNLLNKESIQKAIERYYYYYDKEHANLVKQNEEITCLLHFLKSINIKLGIVTGKARRSLEISLDKLNMNGLFDVIITGDDVERPKPDSEGVLKAISILNLDPSEAIFVGDSNADIQAGKNANVITIGVHWLEIAQSIHFNIEPDYIYSKTAELIQYVELRVS
jgi:pyrophosphatase PpaX